MDLNGLKWTRMEPNAMKWISIDFNELLWAPVSVNEFLQILEWLFMESYGTSQNFIDFYAFFWNLIIFLPFFYCFFTTSYFYSSCLSHFHLFSTFSPTFSSKVVTFPPKIVVIRCKQPKSNQQTKVILILSFILHVSVVCQAASPS